MRWICWSFWVVLPSQQYPQIRAADLAWVNITKYHRLGNLNHRHLFLTVLDLGKSRIKVPSDSVLGEGPLPGWYTVTFTMHAYMVFPWCVLMERSQVSSSFYKGTNLIMRASPSCPNLTLITPQRPHLQIPSIGD